MNVEDQDFRTQIEERAALLEIPYVRRKTGHDVAPGSTNATPDGPRAIRKGRRTQTMKDCLIGIVVSLGVIVATSTISWKKRIITAIVAAAIAISVSVCFPGCMSTVDLDGKVYSTRLDILAPIGATVPKPEWESPAPVVIYTGTAPTSQPAVK